MVSLPAIVAILLFCSCLDLIERLYGLKFFVSHSEGETPEEKIAIIEQRMKAVQRFYGEVKGEMTAIDKKRKRARSKEKARECRHLLVVCFCDASRHCTEQ